MEAKHGGGSRRRSAGSSRSLAQTKGVHAEHKQVAADSALSAAEAEFEANRQRDLEARDRARELNDVWLKIRTGIEAVQNAELEDAGSGKAFTARRASRLLKVGRILRATLGTDWMQGVDLPNQRAYRVVHECFRLLVEASAHESDVQVRARVLQSLNALEPERHPYLFIEYFDRVLVRSREVLFERDQSIAPNSGAGMHSGIPTTVAGAGSEVAAPGASEAPGRPIEEIIGDALAKTAELVVQYVQEHGPGGRHARSGRRGTTAPPGHISATVACEKYDLPRQTLQDWMGGPLKSAATSPAQDKSERFVQEEALRDLLRAKGRLDSERP